jgi:hypothetical protein
MGKRKEHHYVPQFYLKKFSTNSDNTQIGIYNLKNKFLYYKAPIKHQAKAKLLYGDNDVIEARLGKLEDKAAGIITSIINDHDVPSIKSSEYISLIYFVLFQYTRTLGSEIRTNSQIDSLMNHTYEKLKGLKSEPEREKIPVTEIMSIAATSLPLADYLCFQLLINETKIPFITSDNPIVMYNELMEKKKALNFGAAWAFKGLQVFYPISPNYLLIWTDPFVYNCGDEILNPLIKTNDENDINQLNILQFLNCQEQLFFNLEFKKDQLNQIENKYYYKKISCQPNTFGLGSYSFVTGIEHKIGLNLSFNKLNKSGEEFRLGNRLVYFRHPSFEGIREKIR